MSNLTNLKDKKQLFNQDSKFDKKNKLNRAPNTSVPKRTLEMIEDGITIEQLDEMKLPVFKYKTQITVHGIFDKLHTFRVGYYKNLFQNKNMSIGIRWNAIDNAKRRELAKILKLIGINFTQNSTENYYSKLIRVDKENFSLVKKDMKELYDKIDTGLFFGSKQLFAATVWGVTYIVLKFNVNAIYKQNFQPFLDGLGLTKEFVEEKFDYLRRKENERLLKEEKERKKSLKKRGKKRKKQLKKNKKVVKKLLSKGETETFRNLKIPGTFLKYSFGMNDKFRIERITLFYPTTRSKKLRIKTDYFKTWKEYKKSKFTTDYYDNTLYRGYPFKAIKIK